MTKKLNTLIDSSKLQAIDNWLGGPKQGTKPVADVNEYYESEKSAQELDPPGSAKSVARARRRAHDVATGFATSGLTFKALAEDIQRLTSRCCSKDAEISVHTVERVLKAQLQLHTLLERGADE